MSRQQRQAVLQTLQWTCLRRGCGEMSPKPTLLSRRRSQHVRMNRPLGQLASHSLQSPLRQPITQRQQQTELQERQRHSQTRVRMPSRHPWPPARQQAWQRAPAKMRLSGWRSPPQVCMTLL